jgi:hypothetical protein
MVTGIEVLGSAEPMLRASDPPDVSPQLGIWSRALAKVTTEPDVLVYVLNNKPKLVGSAGSSNKRKLIDEQKVVPVWTASVVSVEKNRARRCRDTCR